MKLFASILLLLVATPALAAEITVQVRSVDADGKPRAVARAKIAVVSATDHLIAEDVLAAHGKRASEDGDLTLDRPEGAAVVLASANGRAVGIARPKATDNEVTIILGPEAVLAGVVLTPEGKPSAGASVMATIERRSDLPQALLPPGSVGFASKTDGAGRFEIAGLQSNARYIVEARAEGLAPVRQRDVTPAAEGVSLSLLTGGIVRGRVFGLPGGKPLAGATVRIGELATTTDDQGVFEQRGIAPGSWKVAVESANHLFVEERKIVVADKEIREGIFLRAIALGRLRGRILTATTRPAPGATILLRYPPGSDLSPRLPPDRIVIAGVSGEDGSFDLEGLLPAQGVDMIVRHPDHAPTVHLGYSIVSGMTFRTIVLLRDGGKISGRVINADGKGIEGARVTALNDRENPARLLQKGVPVLPTARDTTTTADGSFVIEHVPSGRRSLIAVKPGLLPAILRGIDVGEGAHREGIVLLIGKGARISGVVRDANGGAVPLAKVSALPVLGTPFETAADAEGIFIFESIPAGTYRLRAAAAGYAPGDAVMVSAPADGVEIVLAAGTGLTGQVLIEDSSESVGAASVRILIREAPSPLRPDEPIYRTVHETRAEPPDARFAIGNIAPGVYRIEAWTQNGQYGFLDGVKVKSGESARSLEVRVSAGWAIRGRVIDGRNGMPVESATVAIRTNADRPGAHRAVTDGQGHFRIDAVPVGFHTLLVVARDMAPTLVRSIEVKTASDTEVDDIVLAPGPKVSGTVTGPDGEARAGVKIGLQSAELGGSRSEVTDGTGRFTFENVSPGNYILTADDTPGERFVRRHERLVTVQAGKDLEVSIGSGEGSVLMGHITSAGAPVAHAKVTALLATGKLSERRHLVSTRTDGEGNYVFTDLPAGDHLLTITLPWSGGNPVRFAARVLPGPVTILDLVLPDSGIEGTAYDLDTGDPLPGALLRLTRETGGAEGTFLAALTREMGELRSGSEGEFRFAALPPGDYRIEAFREDYGQTDVERIRVLPGGFTPVRFEMPPAGVLRGQILDDLGRPVTTARLRFLDDSGRTATRSTFTEVDSSGRFEVRELRTGTYTIEVTAAGYALKEEAGVDVFPGGSPEVTIRIRIEGRLEITVYGEAGVTLENARISIRDFWGHPVAFPKPEVGPLTPYRDPSLTDENGRINVAGLSPGIYTVSAQLAGYRGIPVRVRVLDGELSRGAIVLLPAR